MKRKLLHLGAALSLATALAGCATTKDSCPVCDTAASPDALEPAGIFYDTGKNRSAVPDKLLAEAHAKGSAEAKMRDGRVMKIVITAEGTNYSMKISATPDGDILKWGFALNAQPDEYFTGIMERVVDGPQKATWKPGLTNAMNLHGQTVQMILKPTTSVYAPFYISSRGYGLFVKGNWPGWFDFCYTDPRLVKIEWEGPSLEFKIYKSAAPAEIVKAHALDVGAPVLPPRWNFTPWRWRDEHTQRTNYYNGTRVTGPFNSEVMEDVLMMKAYGIPCGVYWIDRPWGPGKNGYDDFKIDHKRLPHFDELVKWLDAQNTKTVLWIGPFFQGEMETNALKSGYTLAGQTRSKNNYPMCDFTNPGAKKYWQDGVAKLLKMGVAGFKLDRAEEQIPETAPLKVFDGRTIRENRNAYPVMYVQAAYEVAKQFRGDDFVCMPRAAYTGSSQYGVFWGGDIGGTEYGLRASIIAVQRAAVMGYPTWGSDTCGYNQQSMDGDVCGRWLEFSSVTPIMEVGPTKNRAFWNFGAKTNYNADLIALWRMYARLHDRLADYSLMQAKVAHETGMPIVRPLFLIEPNSPAAWANWWTYQFGPDILVSPVWKTNQHTQEIYLPTGEKWRDAWTRIIYDGGHTITVNCELHQLPIFVREGSTIDLGDLNKEWTDAVAIANTKPDLKQLDAELREWFDNNYPNGK